MPLAVDTNVLVRAVVDDGTDQTRRAKERFMAGDIFVPASVLLEREWVLRSRVGLTREQVNLLLSAIVSTPTVEIENRARMFGAIDAHRHGFDFADAIHLLQPMLAMGSGLSTPLCGSGARKPPASSR